MSAGGAARNLEALNIVIAIGAFLDAKRSIERAIAVIEESLVDEPASADVEWKARAGARALEEAAAFLRDHRPQAHP
jgi:hypothetical protein